MDGNWIAGNLIGTDVTGGAALGNGQGVLHIWRHARDNVIGTDGDGSADEGLPGAGGEQNVISGNSWGIWLSEVESTTVAGNHIGVDLAGASAVPNDIGVQINQIRFSVVGTDADGVSDAVEGNVISGNTQSGIVYSSIYETVIWGNIVGLSASETAAVPNGIGIDAGEAIAGRPSVAIGVDVVGISAFLASPPAPSARMANVISGNAGPGILVRTHLGASPPRVHIVGNFIGTDSSRTGDFGNGTHGIHFSSWDSDNVVGHVDWPNVITNSGGHGILLDGGLDEPVRNTITGNSIFNNAGNGIENANGGNEEIEPPTITAFDIPAGTVTGTSAIIGQTFEVFADVEDEGEIFLGGVDHPFTTPWTVTGIVFPASEEFSLTATVTDAEGNTSEFSTPFPVSREISAVDVVGIQLR